MRVAFLVFMMAVVVTAHAQVTHYHVTIQPDFERQLLRGEETIEFHGGAGHVEWQKQPGLRVSTMHLAGARMAEGDAVVSAGLSTEGRHLLRISYAARPARGIRWYSGGDGFDTAFYCDAWMVCDSRPAERATMVLEIVLPASRGLTAVGPGRLKKQWRDVQGEHFLFEQNQPVQTYLFSFAVARLHRYVQGAEIIYTLGDGPHASAFTKTLDAYSFLRSKAGVDLLDRTYTQAFLPLPDGQEAGGMALMSDRYLARLEQHDELQEMTHELAHQWWGVLVGIRSWSDFWLNEGMAEFMTSAYLEERFGRPAYDAAMADFRQQMSDLRAKGQDRPLHWEHWKDAHEALGRLPYVKGALFLDRLRRELGERNFWNGIARYTTRNARRLVDSRDFQTAMEQASGRNLEALFNEAVYH